MVSHIDLSTIHAHNLMSPKDDYMKLHNNDKDEKKSGNLYIAFN